MPASGYVKVEIGGGRAGAVDQTDFCVFPPEFDGLDAGGCRTATLNVRGT